MKKTIIMTTSTGEKIICRRKKAYKLNKKNIAIFAASLVMTTSGIAYALSNKKEEKPIKTPEKHELVAESEIETDIVDSIIDIESDSKTDIDNIEKNEEQDKEEDNKEELEFKELSTLEEKFGIEYEDLKELIDEYAYYTNFTYEEALNLVYNKREDITDNYSNNLKNGIISAIVEQAEEDGKVSYHCTERWQIATKYSTYPNSYYDIDEMNAKMEQCDEIEQKLLKICDDIGIEGEEKYLALSIFRIETGYGASEMCVYDNNYGGIVYDGVNAVFSNPEYGMYKTLDVMKRFFYEAHNKGYYDIQSITADMSPSYCAVDIDGWINDVYSMYLNVSSEYNYGDKKLVR